MSIQSIGNTPYYGRTAGRGRVEESGFPGNTLAGLTGTEAAEESGSAGVREEAGDAALREWNAMLEKTDHNLAVVKRMQAEHGNKAPYSNLAENGIIKYNGVVFSCDDKNQAITLGDMSNPDNVLTIPLEEGGCLKVNRGNLDDLARAIDMFSPKDIGRIMRAIATDAKVQKVKKEIEDTKSSVAEGSSAAGEGERSSAAEETDRSGIAEETDRSGIAEETDRSGIAKETDRSGIAEETDRSKTAGESKADAAEKRRKEDEEI